MPVCRKLRLVVFLPLPLAFSCVSLAPASIYIVRKAELTRVARERWSWTSFLANQYVIASQMKLKNRIKRAKIYA